jgi:hypothetical protein
MHGSISRESRGAGDRCFVRDWCGDRHRTGSRRRNSRRGGPPGRPLAENRRYYRGGRREGNSITGRCVRGECGDASSRRGGDTVRTARHSREFRGRHPGRQCRRCGHGTMAADDRGQPAGNSLHVPRGARSDACAEQREYRQHRVARLPHHEPRLQSLCDEQICAECPHRRLAPRGGPPPRPRGFSASDRPSARGCRTRSKSVRRDSTRRTMR